MTRLSDRREAIELIEEAVANGARKALACREIGISIRTVQRWTQSGTLNDDQRPYAERRAPRNKLSEQERNAVLEVVNRPENASLPPQQIVAKLADQGEYLASESTIYRVLHAASQQHHRGRMNKPKRREATTHEADAPNQLWCWDITWMPSEVQGMYFYWYMMMDVYSRKLVACEVHARESAELAAQQLKRAYLREQIARCARPLVMHSDNGSPMKGATMLATMQNLGVAPSFSRPRVSNDNAYAESLFRTAKYCPNWPEKPFASLDEARVWVQQFTEWYNGEHRHSALKYVTPNQRHRGEAEAIHAKRHEVYQAARARNPGRWSGATRNWELESVVWLNPERGRQPLETKAAA